MSAASYNVGDVVFWGTPTTAGEYTFIGNPKGDHAGKVLILAFSGEIGFEVDADECSPTGRTTPIEDACTDDAISRASLASLKVARSRHCDTAENSVATMQRDQGL
jgi:hypothetical protein